MKWTSLNDLREKYLAFFESKGHLRLPSFSLVPNNDKSLLLINSGMAPMKKFFTGEEVPPRNRVCTCQKCIRTPDLERVGHTARHGTYFEMLGNFSFGDYFKNEAIPWAWEFLTETLEIPGELLWPSIYENDDEAFEIWNKNVGVPAERIVRLGKADNFWEHGQGPCGPCSEIYFDRGEKHGCGSPDCKPGCDCDRFMEIWNNVFSQFNNDGAGNYTELVQKNIDTGMGLERLACVMQGVDNMFEVDSIRKVLDTVCTIAGKEYGADEETTRAVRVVADHLRTSTFILGDDRGVSPSNTDQGYILRRLIRRAVRYGMSLGMADGFTAEIAQVIINQYKEVYPELERNAAFVTEQLKLEEGRFARTLKQGEKEFEKVYTNTVNLKALLDSILTAEDKVAFAQEMAKVKKLRPSPDMMPIIEAANAADEAALVAAVNARMASLNVLDGRSAFKLYDTFGFPIEMTIERAAEKGLTVDEADFAERFKQHQEKSHQGAEQKFKGGLADHSEQTAKLHTATHLLHSALRKVLGDEVAQKGSNITAERLRFDFSFGRKMTAEEIAEVERLVNVAIEAKAPVVCEEMTVPEAKEKGAIGLFESKYGEKVRTYKMGEFSFEICGGPHAENTGDLGSFKIQKEESSSAGVRRIKAVIQ